MSAAVTAAVLFSAGGAQAQGVGDALPLLGNVTLLQISYPSMDQARMGDAATKALKTGKDDDAGTITVNCNQQQQQQQQDPAGDAVTKVLKTVKDDGGSAVTINCNQQQQQQQQQQARP
ncbi:hypothetical protein ACN6LA_000243 [Streptomyces sp. SAS_269]|uniref:hypothetical protein n=1 Tax=Streptomyces sp. SAS_269 TaxID=3412749 RepID=UPI00403D5307